MQGELTDAQVDATQRFVVFYTPSSNRFFVERVRILLHFLIQVNLT